MEIDVKKIVSQQTPPTVAPKRERSNWQQLFNSEIKLTRNTLKAAEKEAFYTELEILLKAGLDIKTALELIIESQAKAATKAVFTSVSTALIQGASLSEALATTQKFSLYELNSLKIAEESGQLAPVLNKLARYFQQNIRYRQLLISTLSYPVLVVVVAVLAVVFLLQFLVPVFSDVYARLNQDLPALTLFIIKISNTVQQYFSTVVLVSVIAIVVLYFQRKTPWFYRLSSALLLRIPIFGSLIQLLYLARLADALAFLLHAKVPMLHALELTKKMIRFYPIEHSLQQVKDTLLQGQPLHSGLAKFSIYPPRMIALLKVGEESNQLDLIFHKLAEQYSEQVEQRTKMLGSLIEPILIVFLAVVVGIVLVSMYLPIFRLVTNFGVQ